MLEKLKIKYLGRQPHAKISNDTLRRLIKREFPDNTDEVRNKLRLVDNNNLEKSNRLFVAILKLSNGDITKIDEYIEMCNNDFRDVIAKAEYPRVFEIGFVGMNKISQNELKQLYLDDWSEYSKWIKK